MGCNMAEPSNPALALTAFVTNATRYLFFTGKGGLGKTTIAAAA